MPWASGRASAIPFQVELRHYALDRAQPKDFLAYFDSGSWRTAVFRQTQLDRYLREEETIFLLDGLDEDWYNKEDRREFYGIIEQNVDRSALERTEHRGAGDAAPESL